MATLRSDIQSTDVFETTSRVKINQNFSTLNTDKAESLSDFSAITATESELNILDGATLSVDELNVLDGYTGSTDDLNLIAGAKAVGITSTEFRYINGVSSAIQTQINAKLTNILEDTTPELGGEMDAGAHTIGFTQQSATGDGTTTIDWRLGNKFYFTFGAQNDTFTFTAPTNPCNLILVLKQYSTGGKSATWPGTVKWPGGTNPSLSTGNDAVDVISFYYDGTSYFGNSSLDFS